MSKLYVYLEKRHALCSMLSLLLAPLLALSACGPTANRPPQLQNVTFGKTFQSQTRAAPLPPTYRCGAWASNNAPGTYSTIFIYARLTANIEGINGAKAHGVVHFDSGDITLDQQPISDSGGYVSFLLSLQGRQSADVPATVDIDFYVRGQVVHCSSAFFTPQ